MEPIPSVALKIRLRHGEGYAMGPGKADLLEAIQDTASVAAAGRRLGLSYSKTRRLLDEMNSSFIHPLVVTTKGGKDGGGAHLTDEGQHVLRLFRTMESQAQAAIAPTAQAIHDLLLERM